VGIGTTTPGAKLEISSSSGGNTGYSAIRVTNTSFGGGLFAFGNSSTSNLGSFGVITEDVGNGVFNDGVFTVSLAADAVSTERFRITSRGNVGIGNTSPSNKLDIITSNNGSTTQGITIRNPNGWGSAINFNIPYEAVRLFTQNDSTGGRFMISTADTSGNLQERMRINAVGDLLVNCITSGPNVDGLRLLSSNVAQFSRSNADALSCNRNGNDGAVAIWYKAGSAVGSISVAASGTTYNTTSDRRLKENIEPIIDGTEKLLAMKPTKFNFIDDENKTRMHGFIAQDMQEVVPEAVSDGEIMSMDYGRITPVIVAALQDALREIEELKSRIQQLEDK
jgi:hypothetical protein